MLCYLCCICVGLQPLTVDDDDELASVLFTSSSEDEDEADDGDDDDNDDDDDDDDDDVICTDDSPVTRKSTRSTKQYVLSVRCILYLTVFVDVIPVGLRSALSSSAAFSRCLVNVTFNLRFTSLMCVP